MNMTLEMFQGLSPEYKTIEMVEVKQERQYITVAFPSRHDPARTNYCHYYLNRSKPDWCTCMADLQFSKRCWHLKYRPIVLKMFRNRDLTDEDWLERLEIYGASNIEEIKAYIMGLRLHQDTVTQEDLVELPIVNDRGENRDRRIIGGAFIHLSNQGKIFRVGERPAEYSNRKGGRVKVWRFLKDN